MCAGFHAANRCWKRENNFLCGKRGFFFVKSFIGFLSHCIMGKWRQQRAALGLIIIFECPPVSLLVQLCASELLLPISSVPEREFILEKGMFSKDKQFRLKCFQSCVTLLTNARAEMHVHWLFGSFFYCCFRPFAHESYANVSRQPSSLLPQTAAMWVNT